MKKMTSSLLLLGFLGHIAATQANAMIRRTILNPFKHRVFPSVVGGFPYSTPVKNMREFDRKIGNAFLDDTAEVRDIVKDAMREKAKVYVGEKPHGTQSIHLINVQYPDRLEVIESEPFWLER